MDSDLAVYKDICKNFDMSAYTRKLNGCERLAKGELLCDPSVYVYCNQGKSFYGMRQLLKSFIVRLPKVSRRRQLARVRKLMLKRKPDMVDAIDRRYWYVKRG